MGEQYYYAIGGKRSGPVSLEVLKELALKGHLNRQDKTWCKGMKEWQPAGTVPELFDDLPPELDEHDLLRDPPPLARDTLSQTVTPPAPPSDSLSRSSVTPEIKQNNTSNRRHQVAAYFAMVGGVVGMKNFFDESGINWTAVIGVAAVMAVVGYFVGMIVEGGDATNKKHR